MAEIGQLIQRLLEEDWGMDRQKVRKRTIMDS